MAEYSAFSFFPRRFIIIIFRIFPLCHRNGTIVTNAIFFQSNSLYSCASATMLCAVSCIQHCAICMYRKMHCWCSDYVFYYYFFECKNEAKKKMCAAILYVILYSCTSTSTTTTTTDNLSSVWIDKCVEERANNGPNDIAINAHR